MLSIARAHNVRQLRKSQLAALKRELADMELSGACTELQLRRQNGRIQALELKLATYGMENN